MKLLNYKSGDVIKYNHVVRLILSLNKNTDDSFTVYWYDFGSRKFRKWSFDRQTQLTIVDWELIVS